MRPYQLTIVVAAGVLAIVMGGAAIFALLNNPEVAASVAPSAIGGPFQLISDTGQKVTQDNLREKPSVIYFGYTYCPEVCPTTLLDLSQWIAKLGPDADKLNYVFVTVDPQRDTRKVMHEYVSSFDKRIRGFTGTPSEIAKMAKEYHVYYKRVPTGDGNYLMDHSTMIYLMTRDGRFLDTIAYQENLASALAKLHKLIGTSN